VNDIIRENGKTAAICAGAAFLLSLLVGLITRNPFGVVLLRAFLLAVLFAVLGGGVRLVIAKYLPDLLSGAAGPSAAPHDGEGRGSRVNIVLPEESGLGGGGVGARPAASAAEERPVPYDEPSGSGEPTSAEEAQALGELAGEIAEELPAEESAGYHGGESAGYGEGESAGYRSDESAGYRSEAEEAGPEYEPVDEGEAVGGGHAELGRSSATLDALPDISGIDTAAEEQSAAPSSPRTPWRADGGKETPADAMKGALSGQDPATLAKAIRTVLKKDEKG